MRFRSCETFAYCARWTIYLTTSDYLNQRYVTGLSSFKLDNDDTFLPQTPDTPEKYICMYYDFGSASRGFQLALLLQHTCRETGRGDVSLCAS